MFRRIPSVDPGPRFLPFLAIVPEPPQNLSPELLALQLERTRCARCLSVNVRFTARILGYRHWCHALHGLSYCGWHGTTPTKLKQCPQCLGKANLHSEKLFIWHAECACGWQGSPTEMLSDIARDCQWWAAWLERHWPGDYQDREESCYPTLCLPGTSEKVSVMESRVEKNLSPCRIGDMTERLVDELRRTADPGINGRVRGEKPFHVLTFEESAENEESPEPDPLPQSMIDAWRHSGLRIGGTGPRCECGWGYWREEKGSLFCRWCGKGLEQVAPAATAEAA